MIAKYKIEFKWSIIFFVVALLWMFLEKMFGLHSTHIDKHPIYTNFFAIPAILIYVFALLDKRNNFFNGKMTYKQGFITGLIITVILALLSPLSQVIISSAISPEYFDNAIEYAVKIGEMNQEDAEKYFSSGSYIVQAFIGTLFMGIITSAIVAIFTKKK